MNAINRRKVKSFFTGICLGVIVTNCASSGIIAKDSPTSAEELRREFESSLKALDRNRIVSLFNWEGVDAQARAITTALVIEAALRNATNITSVTLAPLSTNFQAMTSDERNDWWGDNGSRAKFSLPVIGELDATLPGKKTIQLPYGQTNGGFYLAALIPYQAPGRSLHVRVLSHPDSLSYTGCWVYVKGGKEIAVNISNHTNQFKEGWGDYIKSCVVRRTSTNELVLGSSWFHFDISEGGTNVFESGEITDQLPVHYRKE